MKKTVTLIFNVIFALICAAAIALYFVQPVWRLDVKAHISKEQLQKMMGSSEGDIELAGDGADIALSIEMDSITVLTCVTRWDAESAADALLDENIDAIADSIAGCFREIAKNTVIQTTADTIKTEVKDSVKDFLASSGSGETTDEEVDDFLNRAGVTDTYIEEKTTEIVNNIYENSSTVDEVADTVLATVEDVFADLKASGVEELDGIELTEENRQSVREAVIDVVNEYADENGIVDPEAFVDGMLLELMQSLNNGTVEGAPEETPSSPEEAPEETPSVPEEAPSAPEAETAAYVAAAAETQEDSSEAIKQEIRTYITDLLTNGDPAPVTYLPYAFLAIGVLLALSVLSWVYLFIKIVCKCFMQNKYVKVKLPVIFGWLPFLFLMLLPNILLGVAFGALTGMLPALSALAGSACFSSGMFAAIGAAALVVLWIPYRIVCKPKAVTE